MVHLFTSLVCHGNGFEGFNLQLTLKFIQFTMKVDMGKVGQISRQKSWRMKSPNHFFVLCAMSGVATMESKTIPWINRMQKFNFVLFFVMGVSTFFYSVVMGVLQGKLVILKIIRVLANLVVFKMIFDCHPERPHLALIKFLKYLTPSEHLLLEKYFRIRSLCMVAIGWIGAGLLILYNTKYGWHEFEVLFTTQPDPTIYEVILNVINFQMAFSVVAFSNFYYNSIQYMCLLYARKCREDFESFQGCNFELLVKIKCQEFNEIRQVINETLGSIPFGLLTIFWIFFVFGLAYVVSHREYFSMNFTLITFGSVNFVMILLLIECLYFISRANYAMADARTIAASKVSNRLASFKCQLGQINSYLSLINFLNHNPLVRMSATCLVDLEPELLLSMCNSLITFVVMVLTTMRDFLN